MRRERVKSPDELKGGDRVELLGTPGNVFVAIDLLWRSERWNGVVASTPPGYKVIGISRREVKVGETISIYEDAFPRGEVFVRRRSREGEFRKVETSA